MAQNDKLSATYINLEDKKEDFPLHRNQHRLTTAFDVELQIQSSSATFGQLCGFKNFCAHSSYTEDEFNYCLVLCKRNPDFLSRFSIDIDEVSFVINEIRKRMEAGKNRFNFIERVKKQKGKKERGVKENKSCKDFLC